MIAARKRQSQRSGIRISAGLGVGFLTGILGFPAFALDLEEVLDCLDEQAAKEEQRNLLLAEADSVGLLIEEGSGVASQENLRAAERIESRYSELGVDLLLHRDRCRKLATAMLEEVQERIDQLQDATRKGDADAEDAAELVQLQTSRTRIQSVIEAPAIIEYPTLTLDEHDTEETLLAKLQYYEEVVTILEALDDRIESRLDQVRDEAEALRGALRLGSDLAMIDMEDRFSGDRNAITQDQLPGGGGGPGFPRGNTSYPLDNSFSDLDFALGLQPGTIAESRQIADLLEVYKRTIRDKLAGIHDQATEIENRIAVGAETASPDRD